MFMSRLKPRPTKIRAASLTRCSSWLPSQAGRAMRAGEPQSSGLLRWHRQDCLCYQGLQDLDYRRCCVCVDAFDPLHDVGGDGEDAFAAGGVFAERGHGLAAVAADADLGVDFNFAEEWDAEELGHTAAFAVAEDVDAAIAMRAVEVAHIFDDAENFDVNLAKHFDGFAHVGEGDDRGRGDDDCTCDGDALNQRELDVTSAGGKIDDEVIEFAPLHAAKELLDDAVEHRPAPDERLVAGIQQAHRDHFDAVGFDGNDGAIVEGARL